MAAVGASSADFLRSLICQLVNAGSKGPAADEDVANFMLAVVTGIEPRDEVEAMLAFQMAAVHMATMTFARRLNHIESIPQQDSADAPQQARADLRDAGRGPQTISDRRRAPGRRAPGQRQRRRAGDRRKCLPATGENRPERKSAG